VVAASVLPAALSQAWAWVLTVSALAASSVPKPSGFFCVDR